MPQGKIELQIHRMSSLKCSNYVGYEDVSNAFGISSAVRIPPNATIIALSGMTANLDEIYATVEDQIFAAYEVIRSSPWLTLPDRAL